MIDSLGKFEGFAVQSRDANKESLAIFQTCTIQRIPWKIIQNPLDVPKTLIPSGSIEYCLKVLGRDVCPNYYPEFLSDRLYRKVRKSDKWPLGEKVFIKPADKDKRFNGFITNGGYHKKKRGPYWISEIVSFQNEWRYYIGDGEVLAAEWYMGDEINTPDAPKLDIDIPKGYCGTLDFGTLEDGKIALVEANNPFACGWYGKDHEKYVTWLIRGWKHLTNV